MTTQIQALKALRDNVRAGAGIAWGFASGPARTCFPDNWESAMDACHGSLDAAKALHDAVLPRWSWGCGDDEGSCTAGVERCFTAIESGEFEAKAENPARAWLLAILDALIDQEARSKGEARADAGA